MSINPLLSVRSRISGSEKDERSLLERVCGALGCSAYTDQCLQLLVEDSGVDETVWQLPSLPNASLLWERYKPNLSG